MTAQLSKIFVETERISKAKNRSIDGSIIRQLAYLRGTARKSLRRRKKPSPPGKPPSVHSTDPVATLKAILFVYDKNDMSGIVGPRKTNSSYARRTLTRPLPSVMETGGTLTIEEKLVELGPAHGYKKYWYRTDRRRRSYKRKQDILRIRRVKIAARPFMGPALDIGVANGKITEQFSGSFYE